MVPLQLCHKAHSHVSKFRVSFTIVKFIMSEIKQVCPKGLTCLVLFLTLQWRWNAIHTLLKVCGVFSICYAKLFPRCCPHIISACLNPHYMRIFISLLISIDVIWLLKVSPKKCFIFLWCWPLQPPTFHQMSCMNYFCLYNGF